MAQQLHKRFSDAQVEALIVRYLRGEVEGRYIQEILGIKRRRFCMLVKQYRANPAAFSLRYKRKGGQANLLYSVSFHYLK